MLDWLRRRLRPKCMRDLPLRPPSPSHPTPKLSILDAQRYTSTRIQDAIRRRLFAPSPGLKDATIGLPLPGVNLAYDPQLSVILEHTWVCSRCGQATGTDLTGCSTPTTTP